MSELAATAERLRATREACVDFLILWAVDEMIAETCAGDHLWADLQNSAAQMNHSAFSKFGRILDD
jgi:hypothetical protein